MRRIYLTKNELGFFFALFMWTVKDLLSCMRIVQLSTAQIILLTLLPMGVFCACIAGRIERSQKTLVFGLTVLIAMVAYLISGVVNFLFFLLAAAAAKDINKDKILCFMCRVMTLTLVAITVIFFLHSFVVGQWATFSTATGGGAVRPSFYMTHPNAYSEWVFSAVLLLWYRYYYILGIQGRCFLLLCCSVYIAIVPKTQTSATTLVIVMIFDILNHFASERINRRIRYGVFFASIGFSYISMIFYDRFFLFPILNEFLSGRLYMGSSAYKIFGIPLLGQRIQIGQRLMYYGGTSYYIRQLALDNTYIRLLICSGVLVTVLFLAVCFLLLHRAEQKGDSIIAVWLVALFFYGISEPIITDVVYAAPLLFCGELYFKNAKSGLVRRK